MEAIIIRPVDSEDWTLERTGAEWLEHFKNAAWAESAAMCLAEALADAGQRSRILIYKQDGAAHSRFVTILK